MKSRGSEGDPLADVLEQIERLIKDEFKTLEKFAYETEAISKSTLTRLFADRKDCKVSSLKAIADGLNMDLVIRLRTRD